MNVFIIAALTVDGKIAQNTEHSPFNWTSKDDKRRFIDLTKKAKVVVMGSKTWSTFPSALKERLNIVYTTNKDLDKKGADPSQLELTSADPKDLIADLEKRGYTDIAICGGSSIYTMFMKSGLVKKLYITIEPLVFGVGMDLFNESLDVKLTLLSKETTASGTIFLEYQVV